MEFFFSVKMLSRLELTAAPCKLHTTVEPSSCSSQTSRQSSWPALVAERDSLSCRSVVTLYTPKQSTWSAQIESTQVVNMIPTTHINHSWKEQSI